MTFEELRAQHCIPRKGAENALDNAQCQVLVKLLPDWILGTPATKISKDFRFKNFYDTMAFVNALAWIAHQQDHHPDLEVGYNHCFVHYSTHDVGGLSLNDFICAAKVEALIVV